MPPSTLESTSSSPAILTLHGANDCNVVIDTRALPIVFTTWTGVPDGALVDAYFAAQTQQSLLLRSRGDKMVMISDCRAMGRATPTTRQRIAEHTTAQRELYNATIVGSCSVFSSALVRGVVTALGWLDPGMRVPTFASLEAALVWADETLRAAGMMAPRVDLDVVERAGATSRA
jgi:hypothetical protein